MATPTLDNKEPTIRGVYNPKGKEKEVQKHVYDRYWQMKDGRQNADHAPFNIEERWEKYEKQWNAYRPPKQEDDWRSDIFVPLTTAIIEAELAEISDQQLRPWVIERGAEDTAKAKVMNAMLDYTWDQGKSDVAMMEMIKSALIFGTGIGMEYYWKQPRTVKTESGKDRKTFEYDDCYLEPVRLWDFFVDEAARGFTGPYAARDCIRRYIMDYDDFRTFFTGKTWDGLGNAKKVKPGGDTNYYEFYKPPEAIDHERQVEVLWYWNKTDDMLAIVANDIVVCMKPNPYKHKQLPFVKVVDVKIPFSFYGKGESELVESLQDETNVLRRMIIDRNHLDIDKPMLVSDTLTIEDEDTIARPHGIIPVGDVSQVKPLEYSDIPQSVFASLELLTEDKVRVTGMDERQQGVSQAGTATEAAILKEQTLKRLNMKMLQIKQDTLVDIGRLRVANIIQFYPQPKIEEIIGEEAVARAKADGSFVKGKDADFKAGFRNIRLEDEKFQQEQGGQFDIKPAKGFTFFEAKPEFFLPTHGGYDVRYKASSSIPISKPLEQQKADEMYDRLIKNPAYDPGKLGAYLLESRELDPTDFKKQASGETEGQGLPKGQGLAKMIELASVENDEMMNGKEIKPTPYASVAHTEIHIQFMRSQDFKEAQQGNKKIMQIFAQHVVGEQAAQQARGGGQPGGGQPTAGAPGGGGVPGQPPAQGGDIGASLGEVAPGRIEGGESVPTGQALNQTR